MNFLVDVGVGRGIERYLQKEGYDTKTVRDIDPRMEDAEIIRIAVAEKRMIITMDKDFALPQKRPDCANAATACAARCAAGRWSVGTR